MKSDLSPVPFPNGKGCLLTKANALSAERFSRRLQSHNGMISASGEELSGLIPSILEKGLRESYDYYVIARSVVCDEAIPLQARRLLRKACPEIIEECARNTGC